jgi:hypothetical protein
MKFQLVFAVLLASFFKISTIEVSAQENQKKIPIQLAAISDLDIGDPISFSPGMMLDVGLRIMNKPKINGSRIREREFYLKPFLGFYKREDYHTAVMLGTDLTYRATYPSGIFWDANVGAGYMQLFYNTPVYVYENGTFTKKKFQGYANVVIKGAINLGYDLSKSNEKIPLGIYVGGGMFFRYPNNHSFVKHPYLQLGVMYTIRKDKK